MIQNTKPRPLVFTWRPHTLKSKEKRAIIIFNNNNNSGAPAREARVGQSPILMEYGQPLFVWLSRDWPSVRTYVRVYRLYGWGRGDYQKEERGVSGVSWQIFLHFLYWTITIWSIDSCQNRIATDQYPMTISRAHVSTHRSDVICLETVRWPVNCFTRSKRSRTMLNLILFS